MPHCSAEPTSLDVGTLEYGEVAEHTITLTNTAQAPSHFAFVPVPGTSQALPGWLAANPSQVWWPMWLRSFLGVTSSAAACVVGSVLCVVGTACWIDVPFLVDRRSAQHLGLIVYVIAPLLMLLAH